MVTVVASMISIKEAVHSVEWEEEVEALEVSVEAPVEVVLEVLEEADLEVEVLEAHGRRMPILIAMTISTKKHSLLISRVQDNNPWILNSEPRTQNTEDNGTR